MGGHITLRAMVTTKDIKAGVIWAGVVASYPDMLDALAPRTRALPRHALRPARAAGGSAFVAALRHARGKSRLLGFDLAHHLRGRPLRAAPAPPRRGRRGTCRCIFSELLYQAALDAGLPVEFYTYPGNDHNLSQSFSVAMQRSIEFFDRYVKGMGIRQSMR